MDDQSEPLPDQIRDYFELSRPEALLLCWDSWRSSAAHHDLLLLPGIQLEANPELDSVRIRKLILNFLHSLNTQEWWSIESFVTQVKEREPDFLRIGGEYESMFIKNTASGEFLTGFLSWEAVEGALIRYLLTGPLFWLGLLDLASAAAGEAPLAFRLSTYFSAMIENSPPALALRHPERIQVRAKGEIRMTLNIPHKIRYQVARFCEWGPVKAEAYLYTLTPASLTRAEKQGLRVAHLLSLLKNHAEAIPPNILAALERWEKSGVQASIAPKTVLRLGSPAVLKALKKSKASRYIQEQLGPTVVIIQEGSQEKIAAALVELGFFVELEDQTGSQA
ncbi:MAG: hypothetical protein E4H33_04290 [Anaerolineales bacterium]|nr:MAG: hypothetical protein E4H33_04290 [Anaerolineales bacterium]